MIRRRPVARALFFAVVVVLAAVACAEVPDIRFVSGDGGNGNPETGTPPGDGGEKPDGDATVTPPPASCDAGVVLGGRCCNNGIECLLPSGGGAQLCSDTECGACGVSCAAGHVCCIRGANARCDDRCGR